VFPGLSTGDDLSNRSAVSSASTMYTIWHDPATSKNLRSSAADGYLWAPNQQRQELTVLASHKVDKVLLDRNLRATGVAFLASNGTSDRLKTLKAYASKGVVLAAGALASAPILERSGIGKQSALEPLGIKQLVDLPGVGANLNVSPPFPSPGHSLTAKSRTSQGQPRTPSFHPLITTTRPLSTTAASSRPRSPW